MPITFVDASVFVHAYLRPRRRLQPHEARIKDTAKKIISRINEGEKVATTVVHLGEVSNILEDYLPLEDALAIEKGLLFRDSVVVHEVSKEDYLKALATAEDQGVGLNDALAYVVMRETGLSKIYSFDKDFDVFTDIERNFE